MTAGEPIALTGHGPDQHGITRFARQIADTAVELGFRGYVLPASEDLIALAARIPPGVRLVHLQINDWLLGGSGADRQVAEFAAALRRRGIALSVTLHDLPHTAVSAELYRRRAATYATIWPSRSASSSPADTSATCCGRRSRQSGRTPRRSP